MAELYIAMNAPSGSCLVSLESDTTQFTNWEVVHGAPGEWEGVIASGHSLSATNNDAGEHLHVKCNYNKGFGTAGRIKIKVTPTGGNNAYMWARVDGGPMISAHSNQDPFEATVDNWFSFFLRDEKPVPLDPIYIKES